MAFLQGFTAVEIFNRKIKIRSTMNKNNTFGQQREELVEQEEYQRGVGTAFVAALVDYTEVAVAGHYFGGETADIVVVAGLVDYTEVGHSGEGTADIVVVPVPEQLVGGSQTVPGWRLG